MIYNFLWNGPDKMKRTLIARPMEQGGMKLPILDNMVSAAKIKWLQIWYNKEKMDKPWLENFNEGIKSIGGISALMSDNINGVKKLNRQLKGILESWFDIKNKLGEEKDYLHRQVWENPDFTTKKETNYSQIGYPNGDTIE